MTFCLPNEMFKTAFHLVIAVTISQCNSSIYNYVAPVRLQKRPGQLIFASKRLCNPEEPCLAARLLSTASTFSRTGEGGDVFEHCVSWSWVRSIVPAVFTHGKLIRR